VEKLLLNFQNWLNSAKEEGLIPEKSLDVSSETLNSNHKFGIKKHFLKMYREDGDKTSTGTASDKAEAEESTNSQPNPPPESQAETVTSPNVAGTLSSFEYPPVTSSISPNSVEHFTSLARPYPTIEYEVSKQWLLPL